MQKLLTWFFIEDGSSITLPGGGKFSGPPVVILLILVLLFVSVRWAARDANRRGKSGCLVGFLVFVACWPLSLLLWRWLRPPLVTVYPPFRRPPDLPPTPPTPPPPP